MPIPPALSTNPRKTVLGSTLAALLIASANPAWAKETYPAELTQTCQDNGLEPDLPAINGNDECLGCHTTNNKVVNDPNTKGNRYKALRSIPAALDTLLREFCVAPTEEPPPDDNPTPEAGDGACGYASDTDYSSAPTDSLELCTSGTPSSVVPKDGRFQWTCNGTERAKSQVCYTLSSNGKQNQAALTLLPGSTSVKSGKSLKISTTGGSGKGKIKFSRMATGGAKCKLTPSGKKARLKVKNSGVCKIMATKASDKAFNDVQAAPITITVTP